MPLAAQPKNVFSEHNPPLWIMLFDVGNVVNERWNEFLIEVLYDVKYAHYTWRSSSSSYIHTHKRTLRESTERWRFGRSELADIPRVQIFFFF